MADDFGSLMATVKSNDNEYKEKSEKQGEKRPYLRPYETIPDQWLNVYGPAKFQKMSDSAVWKEMSEPQRTGAVYMSECCSKKPERRGVGANRGIHAILTFLEYNLDPKIKEQNEKVLEKRIYTELYAEIDRILPSVKYILAPKKQAEKKGGSMLRGLQVSQSQGGVAERKSEQELDRHAKVVFEFLDTQKPSRIRMLMHWQGSAGMAYVASVHHRGLQCFRYCGNTLHGDNKTEVSLEEFQECIKSRHALGTNGIDEEGGQPSYPDFE